MTRTSVITGVSRGTVIDTVLEFTVSDWSIEVDPSEYTRMLKELLAELALALNGTTRRSRITNRSQASFVIF